VVEVVEDIIYLKKQVYLEVQVVAVVETHQETLLSQQLEDQQLNQVNQDYLDHLDQETLEL
tara:strand:- start:614 stop:796 length:183 start_codon:yes stop_codon:yes gene_type:complete